MEAPEQLYTVSFWVENAIILVLGIILITIMLRIARIIGNRINSTVPLSPILMVLRWVGLFIVFGLILERMGVEIMTIITATLAMVAIGFVAVWSLVSHVLATFLLMAIKPFSVNDTVNFVGEEVKGRVVDLNLFFTTLRVTDNEHIQVPNNMFFQKALRVTRGTGDGDLSTQFSAEQPADQKA